MTHAEKDCIAYPAFPSGALRRLLQRPRSRPPLEGETTDLAEAFIANLVREDYSAAVAFFDVTMKKGMSERKLKSTWEGLLRQMGPYTDEVEKQVQQSGEYEAVNVLTDFEKGQLNIRVVFDTDNRVAGLWFSPVE